MAPSLACRRVSKAAINKRGKGVKGTYLSGPWPSTCPKAKAIYNYSNTTTKKTTSHLSSHGMHPAHGFCRHWDHAFSPPSSKLPSTTA